MNRDDKLQAYERVRKLRIPERFQDYRVILSAMPEDPDCDIVYDMPTKTIWLNTAARPGANIIRVETGK